MTHTPRTSNRLARLRVDVDAIVANWRWFQKRAPTAETAAVVKADAYGLGATHAAAALAKAGARTFFTATCAEALELRAALGPGPRILVFNGATAEDASQLAAASLVPVLNSIDQIALWNARAPYALHIDTGMNRLGLPPTDLAAAAHALKSPPELVISHLACASDFGADMNARQCAKFVAAAAQLPKAPMSLAATAGALIGPDFHFDMIRPGIGLYGSGGLDADNPELAAAAVVEAPILQVREISTGETIGYGATFTAKKKMRTATVALGYADGYLRSLSGRGYGVLSGVKLPLLGRVSMDLVVLDVTDCAAARPGAWVEFLGPNAPIDEIAQLASTAPYEILTTFAGTVRRA